MTVAGPQPRIELVDDAHPAWPKVLQFIDNFGQRQQLQLMCSRWLATRQNVIAAFDGERVVGHISFHLSPGTDRSVTAEVDACAIADGYDDKLISEHLRHAAIARAQEIHADPSHLDYPQGR